MTSNWPPNLTNQSLTRIQNCRKEPIQVISILQLIRRDDIRDGLVKILNCLMGTPYKIFFCFILLLLIEPKHVQLSFFCRRLKPGRMLVNSYLLHFGNIQERHFWKKIQNLHFDLWWRHKWLIIYDVMLFLFQLYIKWHKSRDVSCVRNNVILAISPKNPESELASFLTKNPGQFFGHYSCWIVFQEWRLLSSRKIIF